MRQIAAAVLLAFMAALLPSHSAPAAAQVTVKCYKKKCVEYPDGSSICTLTPVDCSQVQI